MDWRCSFSCIWRSSGTLSENLQVRHRPCLKRVNDGGMLKISTKESDRGCAIIGASFLEDQLEDLIRAICRSDEEAVDRLFEGYAPFATFSARIQAAFALRLM